MSRDDQQSSLMAIGDSVKDKIVELMMQKSTDLAEGLVLHLIQLTGIANAIDNCQSISNESVNVQKRKIEDIMKVLGTLREEITAVTKRERSAAQCLRPMKEAVQNIGREVEEATDEFEHCKAALAEIGNYKRVFDEAFHEVCGKLPTDEECSRKELDRAEIKMELIESRKEALNANRAELHEASKNLRQAKNKLESLLSKFSRAQAALDLYQNIIKVSEGEAVEALDFSMLEGIAISERAQKVLAARELSQRAHDDESNMAIGEVASRESQGNRSPSPFNDSFSVRPNAVFNIARPVARLPSGGGVNGSAKHALNIPAQPNNTPAEDTRVAGNHSFAGSITVRDCQSPTPVNPLGVMRRTDSVVEKAAKRSFRKGSYVGVLSPAQSSAGVVATPVATGERSSVPTQLGRIDVKAVNSPSQPSSHQRDEDSQLARLLSEWKDADRVGFFGTDETPRFLLHCEVVAKIEMLIDRALRDIGNINALTSYESMIIQAELGNTKVKEAREVFNSPINQYGWSMFFGFIAASLNHSFMKPAEGTTGVAWLKSALLDVATTSVAGLSVGCLVYCGISNRANFYAKLSDSASHGVEVTDVEQQKAAAAAMRNALH